MLTVEKAIKDSKTKNAVSGKASEEAKKATRKKLLIGVGIIGAAYLGYRLLKMNKKNATDQPLNQ